MKLEFEVNGADALIAKLGRFPGVIPAVTRAVAESLRSILATYPGPVAKPIQWTSPKQRAWYIGERRRQGLGPYRRQSDPWSQRLGPSWATENRGQDAAVGTRVTYAPWVQSAALQQPMHRNTGWVTDAQAIQQGRDRNIEEQAWNRAIAAWDK